MKKTKQISENKNQKKVPKNNETILMAFSAISVKLSL